MNKDQFVSNVRKQILNIETIISETRFWCFLNDSQKLYIARLEAQLAEMNLLLTEILSPPNQDDAERLV